MLHALGRTLFICTIMIAPLEKAMADLKVFRSFGSAQHKANICPGREALVNLCVSTHSQGRTEEFSLYTSQESDGRLQSHIDGLRGELTGVIDSKIPPLESGLSDLRSHVDSALSSIGPNLLTEEVKGQLREDVEAELTLYINSLLDQKLEHAKQDIRAALLNDQQFIRSVMEAARDN